MLDLHRIDRSWVVLVVLFLLVGMSLGMWTGYEGMSWYQSLKHPHGTPPNWVFSLVWSVLYVLLATIGWLLWCARH